MSATDFLDEYLSQHCKRALSNTTTRTRPQKSRAITASQNERAQTARAPAPKKATGAAAAGSQPNIEHRPAQAQQERKAEAPGHRRKLQPDLYIAELFPLPSGRLRAGPGLAKVLERQHLSKRQPAGKGLAGDVAFAEGNTTFAMFCRQCVMCLDSSMASLSLLADQRNSSLLDIRLAHDILLKCIRHNQEAQVYKHTSIQVLPSSCSGLYRLTNILMPSHSCAKLHSSPVLQEQGAAHMTHLSSPG